MTNLPPLPAALACFGTWQVQRRIKDALLGSIVTFRGVATLTADQFAEEGEVIFPHGSYPSSRRYLLTWGTSQVHVARPDGAPFITLAASRRQQVIHHCGADLYRGRFLFHGPKGWAEAWSVTGPRKSYQSFSLYRPA